MILRRWRAMVLYPGEITFSKVLSAFDDSWYLVQETWINHVGRGAGKYQPKTVRKICAKYAPMRMVRDMHQ